MIKLWIAKIKTRISDFLSRRCRVLYKCLVFLYAKIAKDEGEKKVCLGKDNPDKTFFVIRCKQNNLGLMTYYNSAIGYIVYALENGWIPVVDMMNYRSPYLNIKDIGKINAWENYFLQPMGISMEDIRHSKNVWLSSELTHRWAHPRDFGKLLLEKENAIKYGKIVKEYIPLNSMTNEHIKRALKKLEGKKILGVLNRGTDLIGTKGHSVQPDLPSMIALTREKMDEWGYQYIFLASEEQRVLDLFQTEFGSDKVLSSQAKKFDDFKGNLLSKVTFDRENDEYWKGLEYLTTIYLLSNCNALISTYVGGCVAALVINGGKYEHLEMIDLGVYK